MCISVYKKNKLQIAVAYMHSFVFRASAVYCIFLIIAFHSAYVVIKKMLLCRLVVKMSMRGVGYKKRNTKNRRDTG